MTGRERLLAEIEATRLEAEKRKPVEVLSTDLRLAPEETGYDPYDNPGHAKPLDVEHPCTRSSQRKRR